MPDFFVPNTDPANYLNSSQIAIFFPSRQCGGTPDQGIPDGYTSMVEVGDGIDSDVIEGFRDTALSYFDPTQYSSDPSNQTILDNLTDKFSLDYTNWRLITFDYVFSQICAIQQSGLVDTYEFTYDNDKCTTRIFTYPFNKRIHELGHFDYSDDMNCDTIQASSGSSPNWDGGQCIYYYGPPSTCVNGALQLTRYCLMLMDGRLNKTYVSTDPVS